MLSAGGFQASVSMIRAEFGRYCFNSHQLESDLTKAPIVLPRSNASSE